MREGSVKDTYLDDMLILTLLRARDGTDEVQLISLHMERPWPLHREIYGLYAP